MILVTQALVQTQQNTFDQAIEDRNRMDWERTHEKIEFTYARIEENTLNLTLRNYGEVTAHFVDLWIRVYNGTPPSNPLTQNLYEISYYVERGRSISFSPPGSYSDHLNYSLKIVTERGNIASCSVPYPPIEEEPEEGGEGGGNIPIVLHPAYDNFMYVDKATASLYFKSAYVKALSSTADHVIYRIYINNTTTEKIYFYPNCTMVQISIDTGNARLRYIIFNGTEANPVESQIDNPNPTPFTNQSVNPAQLIYLCFAGNAITNPEWVDDGSKKYQMVGFILWFRYADETEARSISLAPGFQLLT